MDVHSIHFNNLRNDEHYQLGGEFCELVLSADAKVLKIDPLFREWMAQYSRENEALKKITKSPYTEEIVEASKKRDETFRGLADNNRSLVKHFKLEMKNAATRLQIVFDKYGNIADKPLTEKTASYATLLDELNDERHKADVTTIGLREWIDELTANNNEVSRLFLLRTKEVAQRTAISVKEVRVLTDASYRAIVRRIESLLEIEETSNQEQKKLYEKFIRELNAIIDRYNNTVAARRGRTGNHQNEKNAEPDTYA